MKAESQQKDMTKTDFVINDESETMKREEDDQCVPMTDWACR